jgi:hypothetical protein
MGDHGLLEKTMATDGIGAINVYDFDLESLTPAGDCLYPLCDASVAGQDLADIVVGHRRTTHRTWFHATVRMPVAEALGQPRSEVIQKALALAADR